MKTADTLYVGIDVANGTLQVSFLGEDAPPVRAGASFSNDPEGHIALCAAVVAAARLVGITPRIVFAMESTSNMHKRLEQRLRAEKRCSVEVYVINPRSIKHFVRLMLSDSETDAIDSRLIARYLISIKPKPAVVLPDAFEELREITRTRRRLVEERTQSKNRLHALMRLYPPGYRAKIGRPLTKGALTVRNAYPTPAEILAASEQKLAALHIGPRGRVGTAVVAKLKELAAAGDVRRFADTTGFMGYCRLYPIVWQSGEASRHYCMTIKGTTMLKMTFLLASAPARQYNPAIAAYYKRLRRRGKSTNAAGGAIARKLAQIVFAVLVSGKPWLPEIASRNINRAAVMAGDDASQEKTGADCLIADYLIREMRAPHKAARPYSRSDGSRTLNVAKEAGHAQP